MTSQVQAPPMANAAADPADCQYLTFTLAGETFGVEILQVQEIRGHTQITPMPHAPPHVRGVLNLRGAIVPVIDLRARFGLDSIEYGKFSVIIMVSVAGRIVGLVVDEVSDVLMLQPQEISAPPDIGVRVESAFVNGLANANELLVLLLDLEAVVSNDLPAVLAA